MGHLGRSLKTFRDVYLEVFARCGVVWAKTDSVFIFFLRLEPFLWCLVFGIVFWAAC